MTPNVLLVVLDSVRAANTSLHGYDRETTPFLASLAEEATVYEQARAPSVSSNPSHASIFTGLHVEEHGLTDRTKTLEPGHTIFEDLASDGYGTGLFSGNTFLSQVDMGFSRAFETVESGTEYRLPFSSGLDPVDVDGDGNRYADFLAAALRHERPLRSLVNGAYEVLGDYLPTPLQKDHVSGEIYTDRFLEWSSEIEEPWAACINYMDAHAPYLPDEQFDRWSDGPGDADPRETPSWNYLDEDADRSELDALRDVYDGCIRQADAAVERLVDELQRRDLYQDTLLVITADHGEGFGEPSDARSTPTVGHGITGGVAEQILHVPLIVKFPGQESRVTVEEPASLTQFPDVVRTTLAGTVEHDAFVPDDGPVVPYMEGLSPVVRDVAREHVDDLSQFEPPARVLYERSDDGVTKYVWRGDDAREIACEGAGRTGRPTAIDPEEVAAKYPEFSSVDVLQSGADEDISQGVMERLEDLGYA